MNERFQKLWDMWLAEHDVLTKDRRDSHSVLNSIGVGLGILDSWHRRYAEFTGLGSVPAGPSLSVRTLADGWLEMSFFLPVPTDAPSDAMFLSAWAKVDGAKLLEWTTVRPAEIPAETPVQGSSESSG